MDPRTDTRSEASGRHQGPAGVGGGGDADRAGEVPPEAEVLAALNDPNIATGIHGLEQSDAAKSPSSWNWSRDRHSRRPDCQRTPQGARAPARRGVGNGAAPGLSLDDALSIARQVADALEAAHDAASSTAI